MYKDDAAYTNMRLKDTVVRHREGYLVLVGIVDRKEEGFSADVRRVSGKGSKAYVVKLSDLELSSPVLGNVDYEGISIYAARQPKRNDWRQGLRAENLVYTHKGMAKNWRGLPYNILEMAVYNKYSNYTECLKAVTFHEATSRSFSRNFSIDKRLKVWYKNRVVVGFDMDGTPKLDKKYTWLKEALNDALKG